MDWQLTVSILVDVVVIVSGCLSVYPCVCRLVVLDEQTHFPSEAASFVRSCLCFSGFVSSASSRLFVHLVSRQLLTIVDPFMPVQTQMAVVSDLFCRIRDERSVSHSSRAKSIQVCVPRPEALIDVLLIHPTTTNGHVVPREMWPMPPSRQAQPHSSPSVGQLSAGLGCPTHWTTESVCQAPDDGTLRIPVVMTYILDCSTTWRLLLRLLLMLLVISPAARQRFRVEAEEIDSTGEWYCVPSWRSRDEWEGRRPSENWGLVKLELVRGNRSKLAERLRAE
ncbi:unnamed protein product [Protopolystoma xenopodis]|uniref:Uncharacterized protein n=1 Tax=Protopolystoma xenopodis TaxID=117903 RepID=A0A448WNT5_9PLAT|nr:unnamed protein product [Protopolystoma xenopodis]